MTDPVIAVPADDLHNAANQMRARAADFTGGDAGPNGTWPDHLAYDRWEQGYAQAHKDMSTRLHRMADAVDKATNDFTATDQGNAQVLNGIKPQDAAQAFSAPLKDGITAASGALGPLESGFAGATGALTSGVAGALGTTINSATQAASHGHQSQPVNQPAVPGDLGAANAGETAGGTAPAGAQTPLQPPAPSHGGRPVGAHGDRARTEQQTDQQQVIPAAGVMPGGAVPRAPEGGASPGKMRTVRIVTASEQGARTAQEKENHDE